MPLSISNQNAGVVLLSGAFVLYLYFLPSLAAFLRGHRRFAVILVLNLLVAPAQVLLFRHLDPMPLTGISQFQLLWEAFVMLMGPGWIILLVWSLLPIREPSAKLIAARDTKLFDLFAAVPLILWFANSAWQLRPLLALDMRLILAGTASVNVWLQAGSLFFSALFNLLLVWLLLVRDKPVRRLGGVLPRLCAVLGTFLGVAILRLPAAPLTLWVQTLAFLLTGIGGLGSALVLSRLGKSFSVMPEARALVTEGPYAYARHPLYAAEIVTVLGIMIEYQQPWAGLMGVTVIALQVIRSLYEERVLAEAFPEYGEYRARVKRFGIV